LNESITDIRIVPPPNGQDVLTEVLRTGTQRMLTQEEKGAILEWH
jgi:hypothetical protein